MALFRRSLGDIIRAIIGYFLRFSYSTYYREGTGRLVLGDHVGVGNTLFNTNSGDIIIGDDTVFGYNVMVLTGRHCFANGERVSLACGDGVKRSDFGLGSDEVPSSGYDIVVGRGCWIASGAIISGGVTIGDGVIVAANAVVTRDIPAHSIVAGVPARVIGSTLEL